MLTREVLRAVRRIVGAVELAGMDIVEVSPPYDHAEITAMAANRVALEAISALAVRRQAGTGRPVRYRPARRERRVAAEALARLYDLDLSEDPGDLDLYLALAARSGGPILELAVGSGRLAVPLAAAGYDVTGVDLDPAMLGRARAAAAAAGGRSPAACTWSRATRGRSASRGGPLRLATIPLNSVFLMGTRRKQADAVGDARRPSRAGGLAVVDAGCPTRTTSRGTTAASSSSGSARNRAPAGR